MEQEVEIQKILSGIAAVVAANKSQRKHRISSIKSFSERIVRYTNSHGQKLRNQLEEELKPWDVHGTPPPFLRAVGLGGLEKPYNRVIGWLADPRGAHGLGIAFLEALATNKVINMPKLVEDIRAGEVPEIFVEVALPNTNSSRMPDFAIRTARTAILIENKVYAPESDENQFKEYLEILYHFAGEGCEEKRAILSARDIREVPPGWNGFISHAELAQLLLTIAQRPSIPTWSRVVATLCAVDLNDQTIIFKNIEKAREFLFKTERRMDLNIIHELRSLLPLPVPSVPWEKYIE